jgi:hypothetical protein
MPVGSMADVRYGWRLTIGLGDRGWRLRLAKEGIDDLDKAASLVGNATPRRSTSSLGANREFHELLASSYAIQGLG